ncbi:DMT family transporter [Salinithrix halophila]|uniref:DMT family transporter n=1 Tax=Salinithrix halophila TaxID=1485204 RepID=A0ABV8JI70_9BACL
MRTKTWVADTALLGIAFVWGATFVLVQNAIETMPPFSFLALRFGLAATMLWILLRINGQAWKIREPRYRKTGGYLGIWLFVGYALQTFSLLYTTSGKSGFLTGVAVVLVPVFSLWILGTKPGWNAITGALFALAGLWNLAFADFSSLNRGDLLAFLCAIGFGLQIVYTAKYASWADALPLVTVQVGTVAFLNGVFALLFEPWYSWFNLSLFARTEVIAALLITSLFATVLAYTGQTHFQRYTTPTRVALIFAMEPVFAAWTDWWWLETSMNGKTLAGCLLILCGMVFAEIRFRRLRKPVQKEGTSCAEK